jgi:hypothetical protein
MIWDVKYHKSSQIWTKLREKAVAWLTHKSKTARQNATKRKIMIT